MITEFVNLPSYFIERYDREICEWGANFRKIGPIKSIVLREGQLADPSPNEEQGAELVQVKLVARFMRLANKMLVEPATERDRELIHKHCEKLQRANVHPRLILPEPSRPWLPFMPQRVWEPPKETEH